MPIRSLTRFAAVLLALFAPSRSDAQRTSPDGQEGMRAFLEKRKPDWIKT